MRIKRQRIYCSSGKTLRIPRLREQLEQKEFAVNPFTSGARFIRSVRNQRMAGSSWMDSFRVARNRNTIAAAEREARVARDAVNANNRQLQVAQSSRATLKPKAETSGDIANVNAYKNNEKTITNLTNEQPALNQQLESKLGQVENLRNNKDLGLGVKDAKRRAAQDNVGKQLQAEEQAAAKAQQEAVKAQQQQTQPTNPNPNPNPQPTQTQTQTPAADVNTTTTTNPTPDATTTNTNTGMSGWKKAGIGAGIVGAGALGYSAYKINQLDNSVSS